MAKLLFDRKLLRQNHLRYQENFKNHDFLHHEIASCMAQAVALAKSEDKNCDKVLEISAIDQFLKNSIAKEIKIKDFFQTSLVSNDFCDLVCDDEDLPFKNDVFDLVLSNLNFQHVNFVPEFLVQVKNLLKKDGIFVASFFGEQNLFDLKKAVFEAEKEVYGGISPRIIPTIDVKNAANLLQKAGFKNPVSSLEVVEVEYEDPMNLLRDLKFMMQGNIMLERSKKMANRKFLDEILKNYVRIARTQDGKVRVVFEIVIVVGKK